MRLHTHTHAHTRSLLALWRLGPLTHWLIRHKREARRGSPSLLLRPRIDFVEKKSGASTSNLVFLSSHTQTHINCQHLSRAIAHLAIVQSREPPRGILKKSSASLISLPQRRLWISERRYKIRKMYNTVTEMKVGQRVLSYKVGA